MFAPGQQALSKQEIEKGEKESAQVVQMALAGAVMLYFAPHAVDWVHKLF